MRVNGHNGHVLALTLARQQRDSEDTEGQEPERRLPEHLRESWYSSPESRRWRYWNEALEQNDLTAEEREERVALAGGLKRAQCARDRALADFVDRVEAERRSSGK